MKKLLASVNYLNSQAGIAAHAILGVLWSSVNGFFRKADLDTHGRQIVSKVELTPDHESGQAKLWHFLVVGSDDDLKLRFVGKGFVKREITTGKDANGNPTVFVPEVPSDLDESLLWIADYGQRDTDVRRLSVPLQENGKPVPVSDRKFDPSRVEQVS